MTLRASVLFIFILTIYACQPQQQSQDLLAKAYGETLSIQDVRESIDLNKSGPDSLVMIKKYIDAWLMEKIVDRKAKSELGKDEQLEELVENYRKRIYANALQDRILAEQKDGGAALNLEVDSTLYDELQEEMLRFLFVKIPIAYNSDTLSVLWKTEDLNGLELFSEVRNGYALLDIDKWYYKRSFQNMIPRALYKKINFSKKESYSLNDSIHKFYLKIIERRKAGEPIPENLMLEKKSAMMEVDRSKKIIDEWKRKLFETEIQKKEIQIYDNF